MNFLFLKLISRILSLILTLTFPAAPWQVGGSENYFYHWDNDTVYSSETYATQIEKDPDSDFVILNVSDIQLFSVNSVLFGGKFAEKTLDILVDKVQPDLITLSGDNEWGATACLKMIEAIDSYGIPWAPVMGNHDSNLVISEFWASYQLHNAENCLFEFGPDDMGYGNYIVNITQNGVPVHTLFMMDTHASLDLKYGEGLTERQLGWYKWAVEGIKNENGRTVESSVIMHIPVPEYADAWNSIHDENGELIEPYASADFCLRLENVNCPDRNVGFFELCKELGSTKNIIVGHDHVNCFSIEYEGITLTYAMKLGLGGYFDLRLNGGTVLTVDSEGNMQTNYVYVDPLTVISK